MSLVVLGGGVSPFVRKVRVVLAEKGLDYTHEQVNPFAPPDGYREISPLGKIPAFKDGDRTLCDSSVICSISSAASRAVVYPADDLSSPGALVGEYADGLVASSAKFFGARAQRCSPKPVDPAAGPRARRLGRDMPAYSTTERRSATRSSSWAAAHDRRHRRGDLRQRPPLRRRSAGAGRACARSSSACGSGPRSRS
jgi:hypothetical protein